MSLFKLAVYGGLGYFVYQTFFAEMPASSSSGEAHREGPSRGGKSRGGQRSRQSGRGSSGAQLSGPGKGRHESTRDAGGAMGTHQVGRGVV